MNLITMEYAEIVESLYDVIIVGNGHSYPSSNVI